MNPNQHVTPETGKLLEEAGLFTSDDVDFHWAILDDGTIKVLHALEYPTSKRILHPAPTLGKIWELLPEALKIDGCIYEKRLEQRRICYTYTIEWEEIAATLHIEINNNPADAAGRLLLQLHKEGKLK